jgi:hypothetical protein
MRKFFASVLLLPILALAQQGPVKVDKEVLCDETAVILKWALDNDFNEQPFWMGADRISRYSLLVNEKSGTWTLIQFNKTIACIIGTGSGHTLVLKGPKT